MNIETVASRSERLGRAEKLEALYAEPDGPFPLAQPTLELERLSRKQRLAAAYRIFARFRFDMGGAGHITVRDPELTDHFWVNPSGVHFSRIRVSDLMLVSHDGRIVHEPARARPVLNGAAFAIHSRLHAARPDVNAAAHSHSLYGKAFSALGRLLDPITQDAAAFYQDHALLPRFTGVVFDLEEGDKIAETLGSRHALILQNHGLLTVGDTLESCVWRYMAMENACQAQLIAQAAGKPISMPHEVAVLTQTQVGTEQAMWGGFQPYWQWITAEEPDLFD
ncbi:class II aldolase/adducin family protein [Phenylobacterium sp.]|jgi:ribulose-5-phosphate 4-epimerase/fuculose-1-phosphate aldolase|uniref:class II aldolase/adducin family protein n=1 Tax=Phenylobacterium sp. TaxID=1871053 RepID=UPI002F3FC00A